MNTPAKHKETILFVDEFPAYGGGQEVLRHCVRSLTDRECLVARPVGIEDPCEWPCEVLPVPFPAYPKNVSTLPVFISVLPGILKAARQLRRIIRHHTVSHIVVNSFFSLIPLRIALFLLANRPRVIFYVHSTGDIPCNPVSRHLLRQCDRIIACSEAAMNSLPPCGMSASRTIIHNGVATVKGRQPKNKPAGPLMLGFLGRFSEEKNLFALVDAVTRLHKQVPCALILGGDGPVEGALKKHVEASNASHFVRFCGWIDDKDTFFQTIDVLCLCSLREAFPLVLLEALARGIPVVATRVGGIPEIIDDGVSGLLVPATDAEHIFKTLKRFLTIPYSSLSLQALKKAEQFDMKRVFEPAIRKIFQAADTPKEAPARPINDAE